MTDFMTTGMIELLCDSGEHEQALTLAATTAARLESSGGTLDLTIVRATETRILTLRGQAAQTAASLDWLESTSRESGHIEFTVSCLATAAGARAALGQHDGAATLLSEVEAAPDSRESHYYAAYLPGMVRTALTIANVELAERLVAGVEPRLPVAEHALVAVGALLAEARGELHAAADGYREAAQGWQQCAVIVEHAHALLGQGRCLTALGRYAEATQALTHARAIVHALNASPVLTEIDTLLHRAGARTA